MPKRFKRNCKHIQAPRENIYLKHPVGSNEWHQQKMIEIAIREVKKEAENVNKR
jgi:hypothetical protein